VNHTFENTEAVVTYFNIISQNLAGQTEVEAR
jgi:hypothetical protein